MEKLSTFLQTPKGIFCSVLFILTLKLVGLICYGLYNGWFSK